jgi:hypothetical protein
MVHSVETMNSQSKKLPRFLYEVQVKERLEPIPGQDKAKDAKQADGDGFVFQGGSPDYCYKAEPNATK